MNVTREYKNKDFWYNDYFCNGGLTGIPKMEKTLPLMTKFLKNGSRLGDFGGTIESFKIFKKAFPKVEIVSVNMIAKQIKGCDLKVCEDFSEKTSFDSDYFDAIFLGDVIEHLIEPDKLVIELHRVLKNGGVLIITTPNFASLINRFSLLFGFAPTNYHPSEWRYGSLFGVKHSSWHKSVFTVPAMVEFLESYDFEFLIKAGFSYHGKNFLPTNLSEGMIVFVRDVKVEEKCLFTKMGVLKE